MKKRNQEVSVKRMTIATAILLLSLFTLLKTGAVVANFHKFIYDMFGTVTNVLLIIIIYCCIQYIIDKKYKFYKAQTFWALICIAISIFVFTTLKFGINSQFSVYKEIIMNSEQMNGGYLGYLILKPISFLVGVFGLYVIAFIIFGVGLYLIYIQFYEAPDVSDIVKEKLTPTQISRQQQLKQKKERELIKAQKAEVKAEQVKRAQTFDNNEQSQNQKSKKTTLPSYFNIQIKKDTKTKIKQVDVNQNDLEQVAENEKHVEHEEAISHIKEVKIQANDESHEHVIDDAYDQSQLIVENEKSVTDSQTHVNVMKIEQSVEKHANQSGDYKIPPIELLSSATKDLKALKRLEASASENTKILEMTLQSFGLKAKISNVSIGPNITKYELQPEIGTKVSKFSSLSNDLAMALAATSIRIEAPIPGKAAVGIEIPNKEILSVSLKEVLQSENNDMDKKLQVALGKDITGESIFMEINKTPHMLVAGATGSGKSVSINSFIISMLLKATPEEVKLIMIDPKKVELAPYNGIPHLLTPVVTEPKRAAVILKKMVLEMEARYELFAKTNTRNIEGFNTKLNKNNEENFKELPYIVIIIDELADLMLVASSEVETSIARLAQMARAAGIHLVIATQRPSTDVITGLIKSNIPTRLSFSVSSAIDSRTILDQSGADKLLGKGDMLYSANGSNLLNRIQGTFVSDEEIIEIVEYIKAQEYGIEETLKAQAEFEATIKEADSASEHDELFEEAVDIILAANSASTSLLQRRLKIGFNRASAIMEQMEEAGIVSANEGTKPRRILISNYGEENE